MKPRMELFLISFIILFFELACIRWFPAHVLYLTFFTNTVLLACFLGMSIGCLTATKQRNYIVSTPFLMIVAIILGLIIENQGIQGALKDIFSVGEQSSQFVFFGTEQVKQDIAKTFVPIEVLCGVFFLLIALVFIGPGQELGRAFMKNPNRVLSYIINISGSIAGIIVFSLCSLLQLSPFWWFLVVVIGIGYFLSSRGYINTKKLRTAVIVVLILLPVLSSVFRSGVYRAHGQDWYKYFWSPYYRVDYQVPSRGIRVNLIGHQIMFPKDDKRHISYYYSFPYMIAKDSGMPKFDNVLIIGAGSGNDVSRALDWGAKHVDAVEIDPVINRIGRQDHPDKPYDDPRVTIHLNDGRNFLKSTKQKYDLIIYALVDSLVLQSSYSNIRLESFLFTKEAFAEVRDRLNENGLFVVYNYFRQGWIVGRINKTMTEVFGYTPITFPFPYTKNIDPVTLADGGYTMIISGNNSKIVDAYNKYGSYLMKTELPPRPQNSNYNGFILAQSDELDPNTYPIKPAYVSIPENLKTATDDWPFLYLRNPMIPNTSISGALIMGVLSLLLLFFFIRNMAKEQGTKFSFNPRFFFLGAGFMLIETKAVVNMALLFGSTWIVNSVVFLAVLVMILIGNLIVYKLNPQKIMPFYVGLLLALILNCVIPIDSFLGMSRFLQIISSCLLVFTPMVFAGIIFSKIFQASTNPDMDLGVNIAGSMLGGLAEYTSMLLGFQYLMFVAVGFYLLSLLKKKIG